MKELNINEVKMVSGAFVHFNGACEILTIVCGGSLVAAFAAGAASIYAYQLLLNEESSKIYSNNHRCCASLECALKHHFD